MADDRDVLEGWDDPSTDARVYELDDYRGAAPRSGAVLAAVAAVLGLVVLLRRRRG